MIKPRCKTKEINGVLFRKCADCKENWFPFDYIWGRSYCKPCISKRNKVQKKNRDEKCKENKVLKPRNRVKVYLIDGIKYRDCKRCEEKMIYDAEHSYCNKCASIKAGEHARRKKAGIRKDNSPKQSDFYNNKIPGLFDTYENEEAKKAMLKGDFKAFMEATEKR